MAFGTPQGKGMKHLSAPALALIGLAAVMPSHAGEENSGDLLAYLDEQTRIATRTRINADFVPGIINVLRHQDLEALGAATVWEALALVPELNPVQDETGNRQILVRGSNSVYSSGNIKFMLDGIGMNSQLNAYALPLLDLPISLVDRIEVIRGPGSAVYGEYAYLGVVNVITRRESNGAGIGGGNGGRREGWARVSLAPKDSELRATLSAAYRKGDDSVNAGYDGLYSDGLCQPPSCGLSHAPGRSNERSRYSAILLDLDKGGFSLQAGDLDGHSGDYFGINDKLPVSPSHLVDQNHSQFAEAAYGFHTDANTEANLRLGWRRDERNRQGLYIEPAALWDAGPGDITMDNYYDEETWHGGADATWRGLDRHTVHAELSRQQTRVIGDSWSAEGLDLPDTWIDPNMSRTVDSLVLQDEFRASEALTFTAGLRYDRYSDVGNNLSPRIAAVWQLDPSNILKAQYGEAFRPPTFYELRFGYYGFENATAIEPETSRNLELGYIHRAGPNTAKLTVYGSRLDHLIAFSATDGYYNTEGARLYGIEAEWDWRLSQSLRTLGNLGLGRAEDIATGDSLANGTGVLANLALLWSLRQDITLAAWLRHVGSRPRPSEDPRPDLSGYRTLDLTGTFANVGGLKPLTLRLGVKNVLNADIRYPSPWTGYRNDYPRPGRRWWVEARWDW